jgi:hypothetical protein
MNNHTAKQADFWKSASPAESPNPDFRLQPEGRYRKDLGYDTTNLGNGTNRKYEPVYQDIGFGLKKRIG